MVLKPEGIFRVIKFIERTLIILLFVGAILGGAAFGYFVQEVASRKSLALLANYRPSTPTRLYDRKGRVFAELFRQKQEVIPFSRIPPHVIQAFLSVEDDNFFNHYGIDIGGILRAAMVNLKAGQIVQGGSTLTQQLAKQIFLNTEGHRDRNFKQKLRETILAIQMEEELSKEEILEVYFNVIYLGHGCKGIACASRLYFDKNVEDLTLSEGALLARLPKSPVEYSPFKNPEESMEQHKLVLTLMAENGYLPPNQVESLHKDFWKDYWGRVVVTAPSRNIWAKRMNEAPYFTDYIRRNLISHNEVGEEALYTRGLRVYTTLDLDQQRIAEEETQKTLEKANVIGQRYARMGKNYGIDLNLVNLYETLQLLLPVGRVNIRPMSPKQKFKRHIENSGMLDAAELLSLTSPADNESAAFEDFRKQAVGFVSNMEVQDAFLTVEPKTGYITAMIGGSQFSPKNQYNRALQARRQPGSAFKIFVYGSALEARKISSETALNDAPFFTVTPDGQSWSPGNYDQGFRGLVPASTALALSINTCSVQTYFRVGGNPIINFASRLMKISDPDRFIPHPSLALGSGEVTPLELITAISIIANDGRDVIPFGVRYVTDQSGNIILNQEEEVRNTLSTMTENGTIQVIEPGVAFILRQMMEKVANHGTVTRGLRTCEYGCFSGDMAAKTGTTSSWSDAWVVGFNPEYATIIWFGFDKSTITLGPGQAGGHIATPVLGSYYRRYYNEQKISYPRFRDRPDGDRPPSDVVRGNCGGWTMASTVVDGNKLFRHGDNICASEEHKIYDQRELLMKELGITPEELGVDNNRIRFKSQ